MEPGAHWTAIYGTLTTSAVFGVTAGAVAALGGKPYPPVVAAFAAFNSGCTAGVFFGLREFAVGPLLVYTAPWSQYVNRRRLLGIGEDGMSEPHTPSIQDVRSDKLLDSGISGAITGGLVRGWKSGRGAVIPGALFASTACVALQYGFNLAAVYRLNHLSKATEATSAPIPSTPSEPQEQIPLDRRILNWIGVKSLSDEEFAARLRRQKEAYEKRIAELELQLEEEQRSKSVDSDTVQSS
ncbi:hypothetical protein BKA70DRAFT_266172 [Coprinopsis sp. MPI-PUGE-AT-0042]|nr:hypothetical protein BKA70DRAFT_266172 [Coprinopsis sp. MPI-PUGE-AT-0042]